jgi:hypothetical protein
MARSAIPKLAELNFDGNNNSFKKFDAFLSSGDSESCSKILLAHYLWLCPLEAPIQSRYDAVRNAVHP